jgi:hypothetical protein
MIELADPSADLIHFWDDDDLYLPWHLDDCLSHIGAEVAWKPASCWLSEGNVKFSRHANMFEGAWIFRSDYIREAPIETHFDYTDHPVYLQALEKNKLATTELSGRTSYIYRWANGTEHLSGYGGYCDATIQKERIQRWRSRSKDAAPDGNLVPADMTLRWQQYLAGTKEFATAGEWELNREGVNSGSFGSLE